MHIALAGLHWGDEGKGKVVDAICGQVDVVVRFQGGSNAGHTVEVGGKAYKMSSIPSGIVRGKHCLIDRGVVFDAPQFFKEMKSLSKAGVDAENLVRVCSSAFLVLSLHKEAEAISAATNIIGTTRRGIGPAYEDKVGRRGIRLSDSGEDLVERIQLLVEHHNTLRQGKGLKLLSSSGALEEVKSIQSAMKNYLIDSKEVEDAYGDKRILFEGSQGILLDVDHGTYPYVTSSNTLPAHAAIGSSFPFRESDIFHIGVMKSYMTRVGHGPFPSQVEGEEGETLQREGKEMGTVTERRRRCGWLDIPLCRQAVKIGRVDGLAITKLDVLDHFETLKICTSYHGKDPVYEELPGWKGKGMIRGATLLEELPRNALRYLDRIKELLGVDICMVSTGPEREAMLYIKDCTKGY